MDGYGLGADGLGPFAQVAAVPAGAPDPGLIGPGQAVRLLTGARIPDGVRAVAMQESCNVLGSRFIPPLLAPGENIRRRGEDLDAGERMLAEGVRLDPRYLALLAAAGHGTATVRRRPRVALLSSGDELLAPGEAPRASSVHDSNRPMRAALLAAAGAEVVDLGLLPDRHEVIAETKPGKPLVFGRLESARCLFLPGNPVAALVGALLFARSLVDRLHGAPDRPARGLPAVAAAGWSRRPGREEFAPAIVREGIPFSVERIGRPGSARLMPLAAADGLVRVGAESGPVEPGDAVEFFPFGGCLGLG